MIRTAVNLEACGHVRDGTLVNRDTLVCRSSSDERKRYARRPALKSLDTSLRVNRGTVGRTCEVTDHASLVAPTLPDAGGSVPPEGPSSSRRTEARFLLGDTR